SMADRDYKEGRSSSRRGLTLVAAMLFCVAAISLVYAVRERAQARELSASRDEMKASLGEARSEIQALSAKLDALRTSALNPAPKTVLRAASKKARSQPPEDPRWKRIQSQLSEQKQQLVSAREELEKAREDLQGKLSATRDELSTSIARNHDELVALQKRGERNYYEFHLNRSKQFQRVGP